MSAQPNRLFRVRDGAAVWAHRCTIGGATGDEALQIHASAAPERLQAVLDEATRRCAELFATDFLGRAR